MVVVGNTTELGGGSLVIVVNHTRELGEESRWL